FLTTLLPPSSPLFPYTTLFRSLALKALGCRVIWLEGIDVDDSDTSPAGRRRRRGGSAVDCVATLKTRLEPYGLADTLALYALNGDRKSTRLNSSHVSISYAVFC